MTEKKRKILLSKLDREEVVIEKESDFKDSIFNYVYQKTEILIQNIIKENQRYNDTCSAKLLKKELENIISFEGRRGTGKSSAMRSVLEALRNYGDRDSNFLKFPEDDEWNVGNFYFHVMEAIDASTLEEEENLLEVVLASMFVDLRNKVEKKGALEDNSYDAGELYQLFSEIFEILMNIKNTSKNKDYKEKSPIHALSQMSNSQMLLEKMQELVKKYLQYMNPLGKNDYNNKNSFLVIAVDDIDMHFKSKNSTSSYQLLESIHRYLMIPNIVVFVSYSYLDLCAACELHFNNLYPQPEKDLDGRQKAQKMAVEYLDKVCPIYSRVHMLSLRKKDYQEDDDVKIIITKKEGEEVLTEFTDVLWDRGDDFNKTVALSVKKFIFLLKASLAGLYYDAEGEKRHFAESDNLRGLSQTYTFFLQLKKIQKLKNGGTQAVFKELLDDLYFRFAGEKLTRKDYDKFKGFLDVTIERRSRDILFDIVKDTQIQRKIDSHKNMNGLTKITYYGHHVEQSYSYGELLYFLYHASREGRYCKELIWCILDSYTIMLTKLYRQLEYLDSVDLNNVGTEEKEEICKEKERIRKKVSEILGTSIASSWSNVYMPVLELGKLRKKKGSQNNYMIGLDDSDSNISRAAAIKGNLVNGNWKCNLLYDYDGIPPLYVAERIKENLQILEILCMFITGVFDKKVDDNTDIPKFIYEPGYLNPEYKYNDIWKSQLEEYSEEKRKEIEAPKIVLRFNEICFNIMNFVNNLFEGEQFFENLHEKLITGFKAFFIDLKRANILFKDKEITEEFVKKYFEENSLKKEVMEWSKSTHGFAMPLYSFDIMYNIFKRRYQRQEIMPKMVVYKQYWRYTKRVYEDFGKLLKEEDDFYFGSQNKKGRLTTESRIKSEKSCGFYQNYIDSPFIKFITELDREDEMSKRRKEKFAEAFIDMLRTMANLS